MSNGFMAEKPKGVPGKHITVLSMDGGGVRGLIPVVILIELEGILQRLDGPERRLVDYFDMIAGTSTGGVVTEMITTPSAPDSLSPLFTAKEVFNFYDRDATRIFPHAYVSDCRGPRCKAKELDRLLHATFGSSPHLSGALTSVLVPAFDIKIQQSLLFTSWQANEDPLNNPPVEIVCQATSASPIYLRPVNFTLMDIKADPPRSKEFHLIDGSVALNNPTDAAITQAVKELQEGGRGAGRVNYTCCCDLLVLSLGTGLRPMGGYCARETARWGAIGCLANKGEATVVDSVLNASADMVDYNVSQMFQSENSERNYLRIQTERQLGDRALVDDCAPEHLWKVVAIGRQLLDEPVMRHDSKTGDIVPVPNGGTNREALYRFAGWLSEERKIRLTPPPPPPPPCPPTPPPPPPPKPPSPPPKPPSPPPKPPSPPPKPPSPPPKPPSPPPKPPSPPPKPPSPPPKPCPPSPPCYCPPSRPCYCPPSPPCYCPPSRPCYCPPPKPCTPPRPPSPPCRPSSITVPPPPFVYFPGLFYYGDNPYEPRYYMDGIDCSCPPIALAKYETSFNTSSSYEQAPPEPTFSTSPYVLSAYEYSQAHYPHPTFYAPPSTYEAQSSSSSSYATMYEAHASSSSPPYVEPTYDDPFSSHSNHRSFSPPSNPQLGNYPFSSHDHQSFSAPSNPLLGNDPFFSHDRRSFSPPSHPLLGNDPFFSHERRSFSPPSHPLRGNDPFFSHDDHRSFSAPSNPLLGNDPFFSHDHRSFSAPSNPHLGNGPFSSHEHRSFSERSNPQLGSSSTLLDFFGLLP